MFTFELICMLLEGYLKIFTLSRVFKIIKIFGFLAHTQSALANCQRRLSLRRPFFSTGSACLGKLLAQAQCVRKFIPCFFQRTLSLRGQLFSAGSACVGNFLAQAQPAQAIFQRRLSIRKKTKWRIPVVVFEKNQKFIQSSSYLPIQDLLG